MNLSSKFSGAGIALAIIGVFIYLAVIISLGDFGSPSLLYGGAAAFFTGILLLLVGILMRTQGSLFSKLADASLLLSIISLPYFFDHFSPRTPYPYLYFFASSLIAIIAHIWDRYHKL